MTAFKFQFGQPPEPEDIETNSLDEEIFNGIRRLKTLRDWGGIKVREVKPTLFAQEIVSVQPMTMPTGLLFWLDYSYGSKSFTDQIKNETQTSGSQVFEPEFDYVEKS